VALVAEEVVSEAGSVVIEVALVAEVVSDIKVAADSAAEAASPTAHHLPMRPQDLEVAEVDSVVVGLVTPMEVLLRPMATAIDAAAALAATEAATEMATAAVAEEAGLSAALLAATASLCDPEKEAIETETATVIEIGTETETGTAADEETTTRGNGTMMARGTTIPEASGGTERLFSNILSKSHGLLVGIFVSTRIWISMLSPFSVKGKQSNCRRVRSPLEAILPTDQPLTQHQEL